MSFTFDRGDVHKSERRAFYVDFEHTLQSSKEHPSLPCRGQVEAVIQTDHSMKNRWRVSYTYNYSFSNVGSVEYPSARLSIEFRVVSKGDTEEALQEALASLVNTVNKTVKLLDPSRFARQ